MRELAHKIFLRYQKLMWYANQAKFEAYKPLSVINEFLIIVVWFEVRGIQFTYTQLAGAYVLLQLVFILIGVFLTKIGIVKFNTTLGNKQNPELIKILRVVEKTHRMVKRK